MGSKTNGLSQLKANGGKHRTYNNAPTNRVNRDIIGLPQNLKIIFSYFLLTIVSLNRNKQINNCSLLKK
jgi:hypothetical protein